MRLKHYTDGYYCEYNPDGGSIDSASIEHIDYSIPFEDRMNNATDVGYCYKMPFGWVALYACDEGLILQIDKQKWILTEGNVVTHYMYDFINKSEMIFSVEDAVHKLDITYEKWWKSEDNTVVDPVYASLDTRNVDNDLLAYVDYLNGENGNPDNVLAFWRKNSNSIRQASTV